MDALRILLARTQWDWHKQVASAWIQAHLRRSKEGKQLEIGLKISLLGPFDAQVDGERLPPLRSVKGEIVRRLLKFAWK